MAKTLPDRVGRFSVNRDLSRSVGQIIRRRCIGDVHKIRVERVSIHSRDDNNDDDDNYDDDDDDEV